MIASKLILTLLLGVFAADLEVTPEDLTKRRELVGQNMTVDGRVQGTIQFHKNRGFDEFHLQHSSVTFRLPPALTFNAPPKAPVVRATGLLKRVGSRLVFEVSKLEIESTDLDRLNRAAHALKVDDSVNRDAWAAWGERRAAEYQDDALRDRAREVAAEAIAIDAARPGADRLMLADRAKTRHVAEPLPSALAHEGFRKLLAEVNRPADAQALATRVAGFFPQAKEPVAPPVDLSAALPGYQAHPESFYRDAPEDVRHALDRRLLTDVKAKDLLLRARENPKTSMNTVTEARTSLPDRPDVLSQLQNLALNSADVATLRQSEVTAYAKLYRDAGKPDEAKKLIRRWLDDQRARLLTPTDAEGRVTLADAYESMLGDRATAEALLRESWAIDPQSKATADVFRRLGYRLVDGDWQATQSAISTNVSDPATGRPGRDPTGDLLKGLNRKDVVNLQGKPQRIARSVTQGQYREQWIYQSNRTTQYINFLQRPDMPEAIVVSHQTLD